jgi:hypothetical protein
MRPRGDGGQVEGRRGRDGRGGEPGEARRGDRRSGSRGCGQPQVAGGESGGQRDGRSAAAKGGEEAHGGERAAPKEETAREQRQVEEEDGYELVPRAGMGLGEQEGGEGGGGVEELLMEDEWEELDDIQL